jgi:hypothetical protein
MVVFHWQSVLIACECSPLHQGNEHLEDIQVFRVAQWQLSQQVGWHELLRSLNAADANKQCYQPHK